MRRTFSRPDALSRRAKPLSRAKRETKYTAARKAPRASVENSRIFLRMVIEEFRVASPANSRPRPAITPRSKRRFRKSFRPSRLLRPQTTPLQDDRALGQQLHLNIPKTFLCFGEGSRR